MALISMAEVVLPVAFGALMLLAVNARTLSELQRRADTDALTNLTSRGSLTQRGEHLIGRSRLEGNLVAVLMADIDHFKPVHLPGITVARQIEPLVVPVTISVGGTVATQGERLDELLKTADAELYKAKHAGRNRVSIGEHVDPAGGEQLSLV